MNIVEEVMNDIHVFTIEGRVDTGGAIDLDLALQAAVAEKKHKMVLELSAMRYISSAGLRTLADVLTRNRGAGGDLKLAAVNPKVLRILKIIGFDQFFSIYDRVEDAIEAF